MAQVTVEVECVCGNCRKAVDSRESRTGILEVDPCDKCMGKSYSEGLEDGRNEK